MSHIAEIDYLLDCYAASRWYQRRFPRVPDGSGMPRTSKGMDVLISMLKTTKQREEYVARTLLRSEQ